MVAFRLRTRHCLTPFEIIMKPLSQRIFMFVILISTGAIGYLSYLSFLYFLYAGSLDWIRLNLGVSGILVFDGVLSLLFFLQHSTMIRRSFRKRLLHFIPSRYQGVTYTVTSGVILLLFVTFWQNSGTILLEVDGLFRTVLRILFFLSILGMLWGIRALRSVDMFGLGSILKNTRTNTLQERPFIVSGPYRWVRHPLYLFTVVMFWSCPMLTTDRMLFNIMWTVWVVLATVLEERDLREDFGDNYREYQTKVPMLLPRGVRPAWPQ